MMTFSVRVQTLRPYDIAQSKFNEWVREGLVAAAKYWIANYLPLHFERGAEQRYRYTARTRRTHAIKARAAAEGKIYDRQKHSFVPFQGPPAPWVWSGDAKQGLLGRSPDSFNIRPTATSTTQKVVVPLPIPHKTNPKHKGELVRIIPSERRVLIGIIMKTARAARHAHVLNKIRTITANSGAA